MSPATKALESQRHLLGLLRATCRPLLVSALAIALLSMLAGSARSQGDEATADRSDIALALVPVASGLDQPIHATHAGDGSGRLFVAEKAGRVKVILPDGTGRPQPFLDIVDRVKSDSYEQGLLGLAFHPRFETNGRFFVDYTRRPDGATVISEFVVDGSLPDAAHERIILVIPQPAVSHNGGMLAFDLDERLLASTGDGSFFAHERADARDPDVLLGKILRIDVDERDEVGEPDEVEPSPEAEVIAMGLRNPWRFSVDRETGALYIADVGLWSWEEVDLLPRGAPLTDFGWPDLEGPQCGASARCEPTSSAFPVIAYPHDPHGSVIGGYAYHGSSEPALAGRYLYGDYSRGSVMVADVADMLDGAATGHVALRLVPGEVVSFGEDEAGELYLVGASTLSRISVSPAPASREARSMSHGFPVVAFAPYSITDLAIEPVEAAREAGTAPQVYYDNDLAITPIPGGCLSLRPTGRDPYLAMPIPDGTRLRIEPGASHEMQVFLETADGISEGQSVRFQASAPAYDVFLPPRPAPTTSTIRLDPPADGTSVVCQVDPPSSVVQPDVDVIELDLTADMRIERDGEQVTRLSVTPGRSVLFRVRNSAGFEHDLFIGPDELLASGDTDGLPGVGSFIDGERTFTWVVPERVDDLRFGCTVPGHYALMSGDFVSEG